MRNAAEAFGESLWKASEHTIKETYNIATKLTNKGQLYDDLVRYFENARLVYRDGDKMVRPQILRMEQTNYGYNVTIKVYPGLWIGSIAERLNELGAAVNGEVAIKEDEHNRRVIHLRIFNRRIPEHYHFDVKLAAKIRQYPFAIPIGISRGGLSVLQMWKDEYFAMLIGGMPGSGKSVFLRQLITSVAMNYTREQVVMVLIDMKRKVEFGMFEGLPQAAMCTGNIPGAKKALDLVVKNIEGRGGLFIEKNVTDIASYNAVAAKNEKLPHILLVIDEYADLDKECKELVEYTVRAGRFAGIHPIVCTQRPSATVVPGDTKAMFPVRLAFRVANKLNSRIILDENSMAAYLQHKGRAILQTNTFREVQVMMLEPATAKKLLSKRFPDSQDRVKLQQKVVPQVVQPSW